MINSKFTPQEYYDLVRDELKRLGHDTNPDRDTVNLDYEQDKSPERSAQEFADEWAEDLE